MNLSRTQFFVAIVVTLLVGVLAAWFARPLFMGDTSSAQSADEGDAVYTCPMHPAIVSDTPGTCPICHMDLVKQSSGGATFSDEELEDIAHVAISPAQRVLANVHTTRARAVGDVSHDEEYDAQTGAQNDIRAVGAMAADQEGLAQVPSWLDGRIDRLRIKKVGTVLKRGEAVMDIYSEDLYAAQQEFLLALEGASEADADNPNSLVNLTRERLLLRGMTDRQIRDIERKRKATRTVTVRAPNAGTVTEVLVRQGQYVQTGTPLFSVADLSTLRVEAEVRARDLPDVKIGARTRVVSDRGDSSRQGRVEFIEPTINPQTRTVKVRIKLDSDEPWLPKDAFVTTYIERAEPQPNNDAHAHHGHDHDHDASTPVLVPRSAVIRGGIFNRVYVEREENVFEQRNVEIGAIDRTYITVTSGLKPGEIVVTTGGFLLDSEVQLHSFASGDDKTHAEHGPPVLRKDIPDHGQEFDPPIHIDQAPDDVWLCNMNDSVHWIQKDKQDAICPLCKMDLIHHTKDDDHEHTHEIKREDIPDEGQAFSPSIPIDQAPDDVWLCNMGDFVHWIQKDKKDATCPLCNMDLIHHAKEDDHDHAHEIKREDIPDEGQAFSPSIPIDQAPDDVWLCNMGDFVHWIQKDKKDATCPLCKMDLIHHTKDGGKEVSP